MDECKRVFDLGIPAVILFGIPDAKDARGSGADAADGIVQRSVEAIKRELPELCVITDVCMSSTPTTATAESSRPSTW